MKKLCENPAVGQRAQLGFVPQINDGRERA